LSIQGWSSSLSLYLYCLNTKLSGSKMILVYSVAKAIAVALRMLVLFLSSFINLWYLDWGCHSDSNEKLQ
jgi:hypothetical protein